jgi:hypothetical protein
MHMYIYLYISMYVYEDSFDIFIIIESVIFVAKIIDMFSYKCEYMCTY